MLIIEPVGSKFIRIGQIQELIQTLALRPAYAQKRVVILKHAQEMNLEAANAFLKILEEPPQDTLFILTALDRAQLLETIRSRCAQVSFAALEQSQIQGILQAKYRLTADVQTLCLAYSFGRLRREFVEKAPKLLSLRAQALHMLGNLQPRDMEGHLHQVEALLQQNLEFFFLEFLGHLLKDFSLLQLGQEASLTNADVVTELRPLADRFQPEALEQAFGAVIRAEEKLQSFAGRQLALEALLVELKRGLV